MTIPTVRAFIAGNSGSGKSTRAWLLYLARFQRRLIIDQTGEWYDRVDYETRTLTECVQAIQELAPRGAWTISYSNVDERFPDLVHWLVPVPDLDASPIITVGGAIMLVDEVDLLAPYGPPPAYIRTLYRRSRHVGLSVVSVTQSPSNVSKEVTRQSTHRIAMFLDEPSDIDYMREAMRWQASDVTRWLDWVRIHPHGAVWKETQTGRLLWLPESGTPQDVQPAVPQPPESPPQEPLAVPNPHLLSSGNA